MNVLQGAILGAVQGLGEFLPISSSGHLLLCRLLMGIQSDEGAYKIFDILLHVGTLIPLLIVFWKDWLDMLRHPVKNRTLLLLFLACLPTLAFYLIFDMDSFDNGWFLGCGFLITAVFLLAAELYSQRLQGHHHHTVRVKNALIMGVMQGCALLPGVSRSGSTITGGLFSGLNKKTAARFSFMMSAPAIAASLLVEGKHALDEGLFSQLALVPTLVGVVVAALVGYFTIRWMLKVITHTPLYYFSLYLAVLGLIYLVLQLTGNPLVPAFTPGA